MTHTKLKKNAQMKEYAAIQTRVTFHPLFHVRISSIRSCSQNTGPTRGTKRRKLAEVIGIESGLREDNNTDDPA